ncbi:MAG TPA: OmpA family protein [Hyphomicrobiaceae bacterium]|nr:OmpA family protein [Hyphomicrobiaceae bacterium]
MTNTPQHKPEAGASNGLSTLKSLLFDEEAQRLDALNRQLEDAIRREKDQDRRIDTVFERTGTDDRLRTSVAQIIDGALRDAEVVRHEQLSQAIAPLVVRTIKYELKNSQDEMVDALYPLTGRLVKQYVQTAINDLMVEINAKLGGGRRREILAQSATTGLDPGELALASAHGLVVKEIFLVERATGNLAAHWEVDADGGSVPTSNRDVLISGYISAIMSFSEEAFGADPGNMRTLTLGDGERIFVRGSGGYLLAVLATGSAPAIVEEAIDDVFLKSLERYRRTLSAERSANSDEQRARILPEIAAELQKRIAEDQADIMKPATPAPRPSFARLYWLAFAVILPLLGWFGWSTYQNYMTASTRSAIDRVLDTSPGLTGYIPRIAVERGGRTYTVSGLMPSDPARKELFTRLATEIPWAASVDKTAILPESKVGADPERLASAERAITDLDANTRRTRAIAEAIPGSLADVAARIERLTGELADLRRRLAAIPPPAAPPTASPRELLERAIQTSAVFFTNGTDLRDPALAARTLDELATRLKAAPNIRLRVVGYTDERGTATLNTDLSQARAERVAQELANRGIARSRLQVIGRLTGKDLSRQTGTDSANRRTEFELAFEGEPGGEQ